MQRRKFLQGTGLSLAMLATSNNNALAKLLMQPAYKFTPLRNDVGIFTEQGGTVAWLSNTSGMVVVDTQFVDLYPGMQGGMRKNRILSTRFHG